MPDPSPDDPREVANRALVAEQELAEALALLRVTWDSKLTLIVIHPAGLDKRVISFLSRTSQPTAEPICPACQGRGQVLNQETQHAAE